MSTQDKLAEQRELFVEWLESRPSFRTTVEVEAAWEGWKANTAVAAMLGAWAAQAQEQSAKVVKGVIDRMNAQRWAGFETVPLKVVADWARELSNAIGEIPFDGIDHANG